MLSERLLRHSVRDGEIVPHYLDESDHPWLQDLLEEYRSFEGQPRRALEERLREPLPGSSPDGKRRMAIHVLGRLCRDDARSAVLPQRARTLVFAEAARRTDGTQAVLASVACELGVSPSELRGSLFADLPGERKVVPPPASVTSGELALRTNLALAQGLLFRAVKVELAALGNARAVVRHAKLRGLLCTVRGSTAGDEARIDISGPFSLFRKTLVYGRALGELVPILSWCARFRLRAPCVLYGRPYNLTIRRGDPIFPSLEPRRYDSLIEERFARDVRRLTSAWDLTREPEPVEAGGTLIFPDFAIQHRFIPERRWLIEIVGYWTPEYLTLKLARLRSAGLTNLVLCIDEDRNCGEKDLPAGTRIVRFKKHVDAAAILALVENASVTA